MTTSSDVLTFLDRNGGERSSERVVADMLRFFARTYELDRVSFFRTSDDDRLLPFGSEYPSGDRDPELFEESRAFDLDESDLGRRVRAGEDIVRLERADGPGGVPATIAARFGVGELVAVAIRRGGWLEGVLVLEGGSEGLTLVTADLATLVSHMALALDNARAIERAEQRSAEAEALLEVTAVLARTTRLGSVLAAVARNAAKVTGFERCSIFLVDDAEHRIIPRMSQFADGHVEPDTWELFTSTEADLPVVWEVLRNGEPAVFERPQDHPDLIPPVWYQPYGVSTVVYLPLTAWGERFGVLELDHRHPTTISPQELRIAQAVADQGAIAIGISRTLEREQQAVKDLEAAHRAKDDFLSGLSHELRAPLAAVRGFAETLEIHDGRIDAAKRRELLGRIRSSAERQQRMIDDLLDTARMVNRDVDVRPHDLELRALVDEVVASLWPGPEPPGGDVVVDVPAHHRVVADPDHVRQIVTNLLGNARRYGRAPYVVSSDQQGTRVRLAVRDHGDGVPEAFVATMFDPFTQAGPDETRSAAGMGLGLAIAQRLARANSGDLTYAPTPDGAARFLVDLPAGHAPAASI